MFGVRTEDFIPIGADAHPLSILILKKGKEVNDKPTMVENLTEGLAGMFIGGDDSDSTIELPTWKSEHYLPTSRASS